MSAHNKSNEMESAGRQVIIDSGDVIEVQERGVAQTLQWVVYPSLVAFVVLAAYGFYLVQSLTTDVHRLTDTIVRMHDTVQSNLVSMSSNMNTMSGQMDSLVQSTNKMTESMGDMTLSTRSLSGDVGQMNASTQNMAVSTYNMQRDMWSMSRSISKPMKMFSSFMPFGGGDNQPYVVPPPTVPYYGNQYYNPGWQYLPQQTPVMNQAASVAVPAASKSALPVSPVVVPPVPPAQKVPDDGQSHTDAVHAEMLAVAQ